MHVHEAQRDIIAELTKDCTEVVNDYDNICEKFSCVIDRALVVSVVDFEVYNAETKSHNYKTALEIFETYDFCMNITYLQDRNDLLVLHKAKFYEVADFADAIQRIARVVALNYTKEI